MKGLVFAIFNSLAENAMEKGNDINIRYEKSHNEDKTIVSSSNYDIRALIMNITPASPDEEEEDEGESDEE